MHLFADENVKGRLVKWLRAQGHEVTVAPKGVKNSNQQEALRQFFAELPEAALSGKLAELAREGFELRTT